MFTLGLDSAALKIGVDYDVRFFVDANKLMGLLIYDAQGYIFDSAIATGKVLKCIGEQAVYTSDPWHPAAKVDVSKLVLASS